MVAVRVRGDRTVHCVITGARRSCSGHPYEAPACSNGGAAMTTAAQFGSSETTEVFQLLRAEGARLVSLFGSVDANGRKLVHYIVDVANRDYRVISVLVEGALSSATSITPAASWY